MRPLDSRDHAWRIEMVCMDKVDIRRMRLVRGSAHRTLLEHADRRIAQVDEFFAGFPLAVKKEAVPETRARSSGLGTVFSVKQEVKFAVAMASHIWDKIIPHPAPAVRQARLHALAIPRPHHQILLLPAH